MGSFLPLSERETPLVNWPPLPAPPENRLIWGGPAGDSDSLLSSDLCRGNCILARPEGPTPPNIVPGEGGAWR